MEVSRFTTMKMAVQDAYVSSQEQPGHLNYVSGYQGFVPRCHPAAKSDWADVSQFGMMPDPPPEAEAPPAE